MTEVKLDAAGRFANGEKLDDDRFFGVGEAEEALHRAVPGSHPLLLGRHGAELAFPAAGEPGKIVERGFAGFGREGDDGGVGRFSLRGARVNMHGGDRETREEYDGEETKRTIWKCHERPR